MKTFTIETESSNITAFATHQAASGTASPMFSTEAELDAVLREMKASPAEVWNTLPGVTPVKKFTNRAIGIARIWNRIQNLEVAAEPAAETKRPKAAKPSKKADVAPETPRVARAGSQAALVVDLLNQPDGATLDQIMHETGWQRHTVRGFIAGAAKKKLGLNIESFKTAAGERAYKVVA